MTTKAFDNKTTSLITRTLTHIRQVINQYTKVEERIEKLKYYGYDVQECNLKTYVGVGHIEHKKRLGEYRINVGRGKHHHSNKVYCVILQQKQYVVKVDTYTKQIGEKKLIGTYYLKSHDSEYKKPHFNVINEAKRFSVHSEAKYAARQLNSMNYCQCDIVASVEEIN
jgi:hypothetical protein